MRPHAVISFWRDEVGAARWFKSDPELDLNIESRFRALWKKALRGKCDHWAADVEGALALILLLDQFPRNMFRGQAAAFSSDAKAREVAKTALARGFDLIFSAPLRAFFYLPLMHSEDMEDQDRCVVLVAERLGRFSFNYPFAISHRDEIARFGRFPGRNAALSRASTPQERQFLSGREPPR